MYARGMIIVYTSAKRVRAHMCDVCIGPSAASAAYYRAIISKAAPFY